jgi:hypothetical protein
VSEYKWEKLKGKRLLLTDRITRIQRSEWTLLEISPNGKVGKFRNELADTCFWTDLDDLVVMDVLPPNEEDALDQRNESVKNSYQKILDKHHDIFLKLAEKEKTNG